MEWHTTINAYHMEKVSNRVKKKGDVHINKLIRKLSDRILELEKMLNFPSISFQDSEKPETLDMFGWTLRPARPPRGKKWFYKAHRYFKDDKKTHVVYIGADPSESLVRKKLQAKGYSITPQVRSNDNVTEKQLPDADPDFFGVMENQPDCRMDS